MLIVPCVSLTAARPANGGPQPTDSAHPISPLLLGAVLPRGIRRERRHPPAGHASAWSPPRNPSASCRCGRLETQSSSAERSESVSPDRSAFVDADTLGLTQPGSRPWTSWRSRSERFRQVADSRSSWCVEQVLDHSTGRARLSRKAFATYAADALDPALLVPMQGGCSWEQPARSCLSSYAEEISGPFETSALAARPFAGRAVPANGSVSTSELRVDSRDRHRLRTLARRAA